MSRLYFDHQSATPLRAEVLAVMEPFLRRNFGNPSSLHEEGLVARDALDAARTQLAAFVGASSGEEIVFTSGGAEALNLAIKGAAGTTSPEQRHIITTAIEHPSLSEPIRFLENSGFPVTRVPVDAKGRVDLEAVRAAVSQETFLIATHWGHHELGTIQPIAELGELAAERGLLLAIDAVAAAGFHDVKVPPGVTMLAISPHRFGGPRGAGALYRRRSTRLVPLIHGGEQEFNLRAGTENLASIVGAAKACELAHQSLQETIASVRRSCHELWARIEERVTYVKLNGPPIGEARLPQLLHFAVEFVEGEGLVLASDFAGLAIASGHACAGKALRVSPALEAIGLAPALVRGSVLFSLANGPMDVSAAAERFSAVVAKLRSLSESWQAFERGETDSALVPSSIFEDSAEIKALRLKPRPFFGSNPESRKKGLPGF